MSLNHSEIQDALAIKRKHSKRSKFEVLMSILQQIAAGKQRPTNIMYASNTSWNPLQKLLAFLVDGNFILKLGSDRYRVKYIITEKGLRTLRHYYAIRKSFFQEEE